MHFGILQGPEVLFVDGVESNRAVRAGSRVGVRLPVHYTAAGKAMLAELPTDEIRRRCPVRLEARRPLADATKRVEVDLEKVPRLSHATNFGESEDDLVALAVAFGRHGCIVVTAPPRLGANRVTAISRMNRQRSGCRRRAQST